MTSFPGIEKLLAEVEEEVMEELKSNAVPLHKHGRHIGYAEGCRGPLCRHVRRVAKRKSQGTINGPSNPILEAYLDTMILKLQTEIKMGSRSA